MPLLPDDDDMFNADESAMSPGQKKMRKSCAGRRLVRWNPDVDQRVLLATEAICAKQGIVIPWNDIAKEVEPYLTGDAIKQHLVKLQKAREEAGLKVTERVDRKTRYEALKDASLTNNDDDRDESGESGFQSSSLLWNSPRSVRKISKTASKAVLHKPTFENPSLRDRQFVKPATSNNAAPKTPKTPSHNQALSVNTKPTKVMIKKEEVEESSGNMPPPIAKKASKRGRGTHKEAQDIQLHWESPSKKPKTVGYLRNLEPKSYMEKAIGDTRVDGDHEDPSENSFWPDSNVQRTTMPKPPPFGIVTGSDSQSQQQCLVPASNCRPSFVATQYAGDNQFGRVSSDMPDSSDLSTILSPDERWFTKMTEEEVKRDHGHDGHQKWKIAHVKMQKIHAQQHDPMDPPCNGTTPLTCTTSYPFHAKRDLRSEGEQRVSLSMGDIPIINATGRGTGHNDYSCAVVPNNDHQILYDVLQPPQGMIPLQDWTIPHGNALARDLIPRLGWILPEGMTTHSTMPHQDWTSPQGVMPLQDLSSPQGKIDPPHGTDYIYKPRSFCEYGNYNEDPSGSQAYPLRERYADPAAHDHPSSSFSYHAPSNDDDNEPLSDFSSCSNNGTCYTSFHDPRSYNSTYSFGHLDTPEEQGIATNDGDVESPFDGLFDEFIIA